MPTTWEDALYLIMSVVITLGVVVIGWFVKRGFLALDRRLENIDDSISGLRSDLAQEREDRITSYGQLSAQLAAHKAVCDERHGKGRLD